MSDLGRAREEIRTSFQSIQSKLRATNCFTPSFQQDRFIRVERAPRERKCAHSKGVHGRKDKHLTWSQQGIQLAFPQKHSPKAKLN